MTEQAEAEVVREILTRKVTGRRQRDRMVRVYCPGDIGEGKAFRMADQAAYGVASDGSLRRLLQPAMTKKERSRAKRNALKASA